MCLIREVLSWFALDHVLFQSQSDAQSLTINISNVTIGIEQQHVTFLRWSINRNREIYLIRMVSEPELSQFDSVFLFHRHP